MTLVLTLILNDHVVLVADRRVVTHEGKICDDDTNKLVVHEGCHVFAYTGLACLQGERTDRWMARVITESPRNSLLHVLKELRRRATTAFRTIPRRHPLKRHAFAGVGWVKTLPDKCLRPCMFRVSNFHDRFGRYRTVAGDEFVVALTLLGNQGWFAWQSTGQPLPDGFRIWLTRLLRRAGPRRANPDLLWLLCSRIIRGVALSNEAVGRGLLAACIPRLAVPPNQLKIVSPLTRSLRFDRELPSFLELAARPTKCLLHGPTVVFGGVIVDALRLVELGIE